jgi:hypothetical protein
VRPTIVDQFPERGFSGYAATLKVTVEHGKGETVLPNGLSLQSGGDAAKALKDASFTIPDQDGGAAARLTPGDLTAKDDRARTILELPLVPLPDEPGRHVLTLPPLPVAVARTATSPRCARVRIASWSTTRSRRRSIRRPCRTLRRACSAKSGRR